MAADVLADAAHPVRIGVLADRGVEVAEREWRHVIDWLNRDVPGHRFALLPLDHPELRRAVQTASIDFLITNAGNYSELEHAEGISRIATLDEPSALSPSQAVGSAIVVRADAPIFELADLKGRRLIAASREAFCCYQVAARELVSAGLDPDKDFARLEFIGFPIQQIAHAVRAGRADAGLLKTCLLEQMIARGELAAGELRVLAPQEIADFPCQTSTRLYPNWAFAATRGVSRELARRVAIALLEMPAAPEGYRWTIPAHYAVVDELFRDLKLGRYATLGQETLAALVHRHRFALMFVVLVLTLWLIHTIRVDALVARRARELERMQEEKERLAESMRVRQQALEHASRLAVLGGMAGAIAHELKQPLAAIENYARGIERRIAAGRLDAEPLCDGCHEIVEQSRRANATIERIRSFARKGEGERQVINLREQVRDAVELFEVAHPEANIHWRSVIRHQAARVCADPLQIQQVIFNLLQNAFEAQSAQGNARAAIEVAIEKLDAGFRVSVCDQGGDPGEETMRRMCEPFFTTKPAGLGLGLALSQWILDAHGGRLSLTRTASGVCAAFWLPEEHADG